MFPQGLVSVVKPRSCGLCQFPARVERQCSESLVKLSTRNNVASPTSQHSRNPMTCRLFLRSQFSISSSFCWSALSSVAVAAGLACDARSNFSQLDICCSCRCPDSLELLVMGLRLFQDYSSELCELPRDSASNRCVRVRCVGKLWSPLRSLKCLWNLRLKSIITPQISGLMGVLHSHQVCKVIN